MRTFSLGTQCGLPQSVEKWSVDNLHYVLGLPILTSNRSQYFLRYHWISHLHLASYPDCWQKEHGFTAGRRLILAQRQAAAQASKFQGDLELREHAQEGP